MAGTGVAKVDKPSPLMAGGKSSPIIPRSMEECYRLAQAVVRANMCPKGVSTPEAAMVIIMRGLEVGLTPFQALDQIAIINGRPRIWGDAVPGLVKASGLCEYIKEWSQGDTAFCETKRRGEPVPVVRAFSKDDAIKAKLWGKPGPWQEYPKRMLQQRARGFCLHDVYPDVLGGLYMVEEIEGQKESRIFPPDPNVMLPPSPPGEIKYDPETGEIHEPAPSHPAEPQAGAGDSEAFSGPANLPMLKTAEARHDEPPDPGGDDSAALRFAEQAGMLAFHAGMSIKALPPQYRGPDRQDEAERWQKGWREAGDGKQG